MEIWKQINGLPPNRYYQVSNTGIVRNASNKKLIKTSITNSGYERVILGNKYDGKVIWRYIHRLVAQEFLGDIRKLDVNHKDGDRLNNDVFNLEICTRSENHKHAFKYLGRKVHNISLSKKEADEIRGKIKEGIKPQWQIAKDYNVSQMVVSRIKNRIQKAYL